MNEQEAQLRSAIEAAIERHRVWGTPDDPDGFRCTPSTLSKMHRQVMDILEAALRAVPFGEGEQ